MKRIVALMIGLMLLCQAVPCLGEDDVPVIQWHTIAPDTPEPVGKVDRPEITIDGVAEQRYGISFVSGDFIVLNWHAGGEVKAYHVTVTGEDGREIRAFDTNDEMSLVKASELAEDEAYTITVTAIPVNGTLAANGVSATMRFARYIAPTPEPTSEPAPEATLVPTPEPTPEPAETPELQVYYVVNVNTAVKLRSGPSTDSQVITSVPLGEAVLSDGQLTGGFIYVDYNGITGYIRADKLSPNPPEPTPEPEPTPQTVEIGDSWDEIIAAIDGGTAKQRYAIGSTKTLELSGIGTIHMQLAGFDLDERADGNGKAATTWIAVELLPVEHRMNEEDTNKGGWLDSDLRAYLQEVVYRALPESVRDGLIEVNKKQNIWGGDTLTTNDLLWNPDKAVDTQTTKDLVWIPDKAELFGEDSLYYSLFWNKDENRVKQRSGSAAWWWLRSAYYNEGFYSVYINGDYEYTAASVSGGVAVGFCL